MDCSLEKIVKVLDGYLESNGILSKYNIEIKIIIEKKLSIGNKNGIRFKALSEEKKSFEIYIFPTIKENAEFVKDVMKKVSKRRLQHIEYCIPQFMDLDDVILNFYALLHEIGHCVHISALNTDRDAYFKKYNSCIFDGYEYNCDLCFHNSNNIHCNYYFEKVADDFAFKHLKAVYQLF